jgi:hypothetical protein
MYFTLGISCGSPLIFALTRLLLGSGYDVYVRMCNKIRTKGVTIALVSLLQRIVDATFKKTSLAVKEYDRIESLKEVSSWSRCVL